MSDLISKEKLKNDIDVLLEENNYLIDEWLANCIDDVIDEQPTIEVEPTEAQIREYLFKNNYTVRFIAEPIKHGHWGVRDDDMFEYAVCSVCKWDSGEAWEYAKKYFTYCPNCGARMDEVENGKTY